MVTEKQLEANRNNAKKSTGPRTDEGKARVSQNALKHGLRARDALLPGEDPAEFEAQLAALEADIQPGDAVERELVRQMADAQWRMRRLTRLETGYLAASLDNARRLATGRRSEELESNYERETILLGSSMFGDTQALAHFARYDAHLGRRFERAILQIARLRDARDKRLQAAARDARATPAPPTNGGARRPQPPATPHLSGSLSLQLHESEYYRTNPPSPNHNEINELGSANTGQSGPLPAMSRPVALQPGLEETRPNCNIAVGDEPSHPHRPLPNHN